MNRPTCNYDEQIQLLAQLVLASNFTTIMTGAGMSTESGIPDFRSAQGMWKTKNPAQVASIEALTECRSEFTEFYRARIERLMVCKPNIGHLILAKWEQQGLIQTIITQNVDGFHIQAGNKSVIELHGNINRLYCMDCQEKYPASRYLTIKGYVCECGGFIRPEVVLFGEYLSAESVFAAQQAIDNTELLIVLGSSLQVNPANQYIALARQHGAKVIIVNMEPTSKDDQAELLIKGCKITEVLTAVDIIFSNKCAT